ncbi:aldo/keto reductase [Limnoglobus roseus]|uniref:Aldo/keto reductase n=1 Tax=Limnoglobus roseus TaxID=2598579 RepID=A0A5C1A7N1_9BACT|nr:aldo/keto reductase [Limnoglobus roseus]QEL14485.1 aldo/keto reductase [Limnoglobus roseus]
MHRRPLGNTGLSVSIVSMGGAAIGQQYGPVSASEVADTIHAGIDAGINLIDTSAFYGEGRSEEVLGEVLQGGWREKVLICTKAGRQTRKQFDFTPAGMRASLEASLRRLRVDSVDILLAHDIEFADEPERVFTDTADVLHRFKTEGKCRFVGMSCYPLGVLRQAIERCRLDVVISFCHFNLQNQRLLTELLPVAQSHGVGVLNASPLAMGLLTNQGPPPWHPAGDVVKRTCAAAATFCREHGADIATLGMQFCYGEAAIPSTITGTAKRSELDANLKALASPVDEVMMKDVRAVLEPIRDHVWSTGR